MSYLMAVLLCTSPLPTPAADFADADMELADRGPWNVYGTPVTVEKGPFARSGVQSLQVVTDNQETMGGNYEGTSHGLGEFQPGDVLRLSFWYNVKDSKSIVVGMGRTSFEGRWVLSGTDWTRADVSLRCTHPGPHNVWISQGGDATEFFLDDFALEVDRRRANRQRWWVGLYVVPSAARPGRSPASRTWPPAKSTPPSANASRSSAWNSCLPTASASRRCRSREPGS